MIDARDVVQYIVKQLVDDPDAVQVTASGDDIHITVKKSDMGKIIGKQGRIAKAIRTLMYAVGMKENRRYNVEIDEAEAEE